MPVITRIAEFHAEMLGWRHRLHAHPETAFEEHKTAELVTELLKSFGIPVERGIAGLVSSARSKGQCRAAARLHCAPTWTLCTSRDKTNCLCLATPRPDAGMRSRWP